MQQLAAFAQVNGAHIEISTIYSYIGHFMQIFCIPKILVSCRILMSQLKLHQNVIVMHSVS